MVIYAMIMFVTAGIFAIVAAKIYKGKTELIHAYHQTKVMDKVGYGKAFGKGLGVITAGMYLSGIVGLFGDTTVIAMASVVVLFVGLFAGLYCIYRVQKRYNSGIF